MSGRSNMPALGEVISGRYRLDAVIGFGGMGTVFRAEHINMGKTVALKMLHMSQPDRTSLKRFRMEAKLASQLSHPNIVSITDFDVDQNRPYIVMEYLKGRSLERLLKDDATMPVDRFLNIMTQACRGLGYAHKNGLIHRDIKMSNLMLVDRGGEKDVLVIVDFGLVDVMSDDEVADGAAKSTVGSPMYMSPEQCRGERVDQRSDIYSLGCVMYRCLTGQVPFKGEEVRETFRMQVLEPPRPFRDVNAEIKIPPGLERVVMKSLAKDPDERQKDMSVLADELAVSTKRRTLLDESDASGVTSERSMLNREQIQKYKNDSSSIGIVTLVVAAAALIFIALYSSVKSMVSPENPAPSKHENHE